MDKIIRSWLLICSLVGLLGGLVKAIPVVAQQETVVRCRLESSQIVIGEETELFLDVLDITDFYGYQLEVAFNPNLLRAYGSPGDPQDVRMTLGNFLNPDFVGYNDIHNEFGAILLAVSQIQPALPANGSGVLASGYLSGVAAGSVEITFEEVILLDSDGEEISHRVENCSVLVSTAGQVSATPTTTPTGSLTPTTSQATSQHTATQTATSTITPTPSVTMTSGPSLTPTITLTPPPSETPTITLSPTLSPTPTIYVSPTPMPSVVITTETPYPSETPTATLSPTPTSTPVPLPAPHPLNVMVVMLCVTFCLAMLALIAVIVGVTWYLKQSQNNNDS